MLRSLLAVSLAASLIACSRPTPPGVEQAASTAEASVPVAPSVAPPASAPPAVPTAGRPLAQDADTLASSAGEIRITPLHHGSLRLDFAGKPVFVDPTKDARYESESKASAILLTDLHPDHLDPETIEKLSTPDTVILAPPAVAEKLPKTTGKLRVMKNGEVTTPKEPAVPAIPALGVEAVPMYNIQRGPGPGKLYHDKGRGNGYVLTHGDKRVYISGDTECVDEMKALKNIDVAFVSMNLPYTMPPSEALQCIRAFSPKVVYPYHFRGSNPSEVSNGLAGGPIEVRVRNWY